MLSDLDRPAPLRTTASVSPARRRAHSLQSKVASPRKPWRHNHCGSETPEKTNEAIFVFRETPPRPEHAASQKNARLLSCLASGFRFPGSPLIALRARCSLWEELF